MNRKEGIAQRSCAYDFRSNSNSYENTRRDFIKSCGSNYNGHNNRTSVGCTPEENVSDSHEEFKKETDISAGLIQTNECAKRNNKKNQLATNCLNAQGTDRTRFDSQECLNDENIKTSYNCMTKSCQDSKSCFSERTPKRISYDEKNIPESFSTQKFQRPATRCLGDDRSRKKSNCESNRTRRCDVQPFQNKINTSQNSNLNMDVRSRVCKNNNPRRTNQERIDSTVQKSGCDNARKSCSHTTTSIEDFIASICDIHKDQGYTQEPGFEDKLCKKPTDRACPNKCESFVFDKKCNKNGKTNCSKDTSSDNLSYVCKTYNTGGCNEKKDTPISRDENKERRNKVKNHCSKDKDTENIITYKCKRRNTGDCNEKRSFYTPSRHEGHTNFCKDNTSATKNINYECKRHNTGDSNKKRNCKPSQLDEHNNCCQDNPDTKNTITYICKRCNADDYNNNEAQNNTKTSCLQNKENVTYKCKLYNTKDCIQGLNTFTPSGIGEKNIRIKAKKDCSQDKSHIKSYKCKFRNTGNCNQDRNISTSYGIDEKNIQDKEQFFSSQDTPSKTQNTITCGSKRENIECGKNNPANQLPNQDCPPKRRMSIIYKSI